MAHAGFITGFEDTRSAKHADREIGVPGGKYIRPDYLRTGEGRQPGTPIS
jgi:hypothetical protein